MTKRYQRGKEKSYFRGQKIQWPRDTKEVNRSRSVLLFTSLVSLGHCIVCPLIYDFCLPLWYLLVIVFSILWFTTSVYLFGIYRWGKQKSYIRGQTIQWPRDTKEVKRSRISEDRKYNDQEIPKRFTSLVSLGHCIVCPLIYDYCLPLWYLLVIVLSVLWYTTWGKQKS
jgi:succinate dehydrogenase/fumarate reductase-like Fe-S protein